MSAARTRFLDNVEGLRAALQLDPFAVGATSTVEPPALIILRRGILIAALIAFEAFVRDRTAELLTNLRDWPASYSDLPQKLRDASLVNSLSHLHKYAQMLRKQGEDYEIEVISELKKLISVDGPSFGFSKFTSGDYTGNLSADNVSNLAGVFSLHDCWNQFRMLATSVGFGVPSVKQLFDAVVRNRHRSAHSPNFSPTIADIVSLPADLTCLAGC